MLLYTSSAPFPPGFGDLLARYVEGGGGVLVMAVATNAGTYGLSGRFDTERQHTLHISIT